MDTKELPKIDVPFNFMARVWMQAIDGYARPSLPALFEHLRREFKFEPYDGERMVVMGERKPGWEVVEAELVAIAPGVVICNFPDDRQAAWLCSGILERMEHPWLYAVRTFSRCTNDFSGAAYFKTGAILAAHKDSAVTFSWNYGRDEVARIGISEYRWALMKEWIDRRLVHS